MTTEQLNNIKLVQEIQKRPCLYDTSLIEYKSNETVSKAWDEIGEIFNLTGLECKYKWKNIRSVFVRQLRMSSSKSHYLYDCMQFCRPFVKYTLQVSKSAKRKKKIKREKDIHDDGMIVWNMPINSEPSLPTNSPVQNSEDGFKPEEPSTTSAKSKNNIKTTFEDKETVEESLREYIAAKKARMEEKVVDAEDPKRMFLLSLLPEVKAMSDAQMRKFRRRIISLIDEIIEEGS